MTTPARPSIEERQARLDTVCARLGVPGFAIRRPTQEPEARPESDRQNPVGADREGQQPPPATPE